MDAIQIGELIDARTEIIRQTRDLIFMEGDLVGGSRMVANAASMLCNILLLAIHSPLATN
ncbi:hypothetical protein [Microvirga subterranea]|uniref:Uncharacterized protein n=1 Tax=Microvirga subterranea TaxID=186651 RepID=A0A370H727_9HYPH|nr:hypothetical protein [Microvirga subterranea]RDI52278.1 hypothetical protein DES45_11642 [Microvirga subterranea]